MDIRALNRSRPTGQRGQQIVSGMVSMSQPVPTHFDDPVYVVITAHSSDISYPMSWPAIHGNTMPVKGTLVTVQYDENNTPTISWWAGSHS